MKDHWLLTFHWEGVQGIEWHCYMEGVSFISIYLFMWTKNLHSYSNEDKTNQKKGKAGENWCRVLSSFSNK